MNRRDFLHRTALLTAGSSLLTATTGRLRALGAVQDADSTEDLTMDFEKLEKSESDWKEILTPDEFYVLREEGTERAGTSPLDDEKRDGVFICAGCFLPLFKSEWKFDSGTGWPSFYTAIDGHTETKRDFKLVIPRTEYHCARCGGHQGHIFKDGPEPTGERWCNNGVALDFVPEGEELPELRT